MKKDGVLSIGIDYKKELNKFINDFENSFSELSKNKQIEEGVQEQFQSVIAEMRQFKSTINNEIDKLGESKVSQSSFKSFKQTVNNNLSTIKEDIDKLDTSLSALTDQMGLLSNGIDISKISQQFAEWQSYIEATHQTISNLIDVLNNQGISLFSFDPNSVQNVKNIIKNIDKEISLLDKDTGATYELFNYDQAQQELNGLSAKLVSTVEQLENLKKQASTMDSSSIGFQKTQGEIALLELRAARINEVIDSLFDATEKNNIKINIDDSFFDTYDKYTSNLSERYDAIVELAKNARKALKDIIDSENNSLVKVSSEMNANSAEFVGTVTIETSGSELWKKLYPSINELQDILNNNPVVAPIKLVIAPTAISNKDGEDNNISKRYSKKYSKVLAQTNEDAVIDLEGVYKKTFTSIMDAAVSYAKDTIKKIQDTFDKNLINIKFDISKEEQEKINNFILSNKDGNKIDISGQILKAKKDIEDLNKSIEKTSTLLQEAKAKGNVKFDGFDKLAQDISKNINELEQLQNILKALQNIEITVARANGISSVTEIENQWESLEKHIINATKLDGSFRKNIKIDKIASEYQKYIDMGGTNSISDISKIKNNKETINSIINKVKELNSQKVDNSKIDNVNNDLSTTKVLLDDIVLRIDNLIELTRKIGNTFYKIFKPESTSDLNKQWDLISKKFQSIADNSGKINLSKQKKEIKELLLMFLEYQKLGGTKTPIDLTDNIETIAKLNKEYNKLDKVNGQNDSANINKEKENFNTVETSVGQLTSAINKKTDAIKEEANTMELAARAEVKSIGKIIQAIQSLIDKIETIPNIDIKISDKLLAGSQQPEARNKGQKNTNKIDIPQTDKEKSAMEDMSSATERAVQSTEDFTKATEDTSTSLENFKEKTWKIISQVGEASDDRFSATYEKNKGQIAAVTWRAVKDDEGNYVYDELGDKEYTQSVTTISNYQKLEKEIISADNALRKLEDDKKAILELDSKADTTFIQAQIDDQKEYIKLLEQTITYIANVKSVVQKEDGSEEEVYSYFIDEQAIQNARLKAKRDYELSSGAKQEKKSATQTASDEKKKLANITQVNRALSKQQISIEKIERTYNKAVNPDLDKFVSNTNDLTELETEKNKIITLINKLKNQPRTSSNEDEFLELERLIARYKQLAKYKLVANNPTKQELGGQKLDILISEKIADYDKLIAKAQTYGEETKNIVEELKKQRYLLSQTDNAGNYIATVDSYYDARDFLKVRTADFQSFEALNKIKQREKQLDQSIVDNALSDQISAWRQIQSIREKIVRATSTEEIEALKESKKYYQEKYITANKILKAHSDLYNKEEQMLKLEQIRLETNAKIAHYKGNKEKISNDATNKQISKAINSTKNRINTLSNNPELSDQFNNIIKQIGNYDGLQIETLPDLTEEFQNVKNKIDALNKDLASGKITLEDYNNTVESIISNYTNLVEVERQIAKEIQDQKEKQIKTGQDFLQEQQDYLSTTQENEAIQKNKDVYQELLSTIKEYSDVKKRLANNKALDGDIERADILESKIYDLQHKGILSTSQINKSNRLLDELYSQIIKIEKEVNKNNKNSITSLYDNLNVYEGNINKLKSSKSYDKNSKYAQALDEYSNKFQIYKNAVTEANNLEIVDEGTIENIQRLKKEVDDAAISVKNMYKGSTSLSRDKLYDKVHKYMKDNTGISKDFKIELQQILNTLDQLGSEADVSDLTDQFYKLKFQIREAGQEGKSFLDIIKNKAMYGLAAQIGMYFGFNDIIRYIREGVSVVKELDTALTEMRKVSDETVDSLKDFQKASFDVAKQIGTTALEVQNSTADFMRLGYALDDASQLSVDANIYANVGDMDISEATEHMISSIQAWQSEFTSTAEASTNIIDRYNEVGNRFAITSADIGSAMERSAAALKAAGNDLNESIGLIVAGNLIQQDADTTANALKVLSLRIRGSKADLEELGESTDDLADSTSKLREQVKALTGVDIMLDENTYKSTATIIQELGAVWDKLTDVSKSATLEILAGKTRASTVAGLIENYKTIGSVIKTAEQSAGSAREENLRYIESIEGRLNILSTQAQEFWYTFINSDAIKDGITLLTNLLEVLTKIVDTFGSLGTVATIGGAVLGAQGYGLT